MLLHCEHQSEVCGQMMMHVLLPDTYWVTSGHCQVSVSSISQILNLAVSSVSIEIAK